ncbi:hypothetical protein NOF04DRAFT_6796 [Fusarium oxysporum II5]|uniref:Uncharacterized protein n=2 Tax=Fusarium oxysporum f. sp. cubense (strain race 4) TaxID=2502994 RepID=N1RX39_FUSC4|nr:uncharacterized protein FOIG_09930 [Fusarium odoratissimum NRRL 54006]EMT68757.1 hypothetical protein FOC4_g10004842 [Fusarium odoratissimum]EXL97605.1 hypothetical protein FOIG_09930 [Fusarium odoratissimum NRRL 54006]KAK2122580.1 hypothetical protein NOF04DRAFT_6796 [Fusarium oxysporum II5]
MGNHTKVVDGVVVTNTDVPPPRDWTNVYEDIGGDMRWNEDMEEMVKARGIDGDVQPFYGTCSYTGETLFLMQVGGKGFFFYNALEDSMYYVRGNLSLEKIVSGLDQQGLNAFDLEEL